MAPISINVRPSTGQTFKVQVDAEETTVLGLKEIIATSMGDVSSNDLKLVFSGRILKNEDKCSDYKIAEGNTVHVVRSGTNRAPAKPKTTASQEQEQEQQKPQPQPQQQQQQQQQQQRSTPTTPSLFNLPGLSGNMNPFGGDMGMPNMDPELIRQMMDSPFMQGLLDNPEFIRSMIMNNPQIKAIAEQNPEVGHLISDPSFLRQSIEMMRNPELMREMQRNNDRALSNIEAIPGGFNHLRRMYSTIQEPMESAMSPAGLRSSEEANERLARQLNVSSVPENSLNTQALPNPWAATPQQPPQQQQQQNNSSSATQQQPFAQNPFASLFGAPTFPLGQQQQQQPSQSADNQPSSTTPFWADPNFMQATMRLQQSLLAAQQRNNESTSQPNLFQQMMGIPFNNDIFGAQSQTQTPTEPPEVRFRDQLAQLEEMGFSEKTANVRALLATGGNVEAAIEYLLTSS
ncbi:hypothetical protein BCV72DRAFT_47483 [Rhizopus microsporus var. microsporus]|uniref:Ubiquilin n=2 Tax=Rhizopus microsporus TaxID=58291 RepID=A0A2G4T8R7_RHIZD|nr:uncharacterized protein RHIMIDRAFT_310136 [Rhizopus microsporus ATCC 52813]ORE09937.1 hypothetical protein BCV72DRAFT_47483 [Rhizopus microsporus var. microsporus]PHZ17408.1 hypothetical protein RHIMIDRAFT_310136 [Rhizopus microsporus ATCC 52813]